MAATREHLRASDRDRDEVVERLREAASEGRIGHQELEDRVMRAFASTTYGDLDRLTDDLPAAPARPPAPRSRPARAGFWRRLAAYLIDSIVIGAVAAIVQAVVGAHGNWLPAVFAAAYLVAFEGSELGGGVGKLAMGIRIVDVDTGGPIGYWRAAVRWIGRIISTIPLFLGWLWMLWDDERQCWHDKLARDVVVFRDGRTESEPRARPY